MGWENTRFLPACVYRAIRERLSVWTTVDGVVFVFILSLFCKLLLSHIFPFSNKSQILMGLCALVYM